MATFINDDFLLSSDFAKELYHRSAENMPIIDYHCHLSPKMIAENHQFSDMAEIWLGGDHYKWRALRGNGVDEKFITGDASSWEKFEKWAETMPYTMRNPLYHWSHLELARAFGIYDVLKPSTAREIFDECNRLLATDEFRAQGLMKKFNVETVCTTDDPIDSLEYHKYIAEHPFGVKVLPAWRPDRVVEIGKPGFIAYVHKLAEVSGVGINDYKSLMTALRARHDFFESMGCKLSDHGHDTFFAEDFTLDEINVILKKALDGQQLTSIEIDKYRSAILLDLARMDAHSDWTQQFHIGAIRNNHSRMFDAIGADTGYDAIADHRCAEAGHKFLDRLAVDHLLARTILYNLNPKDNAVLAAMAYTFNEGPTPGKMQLGSGWWFLDNEQGMRAQIDTLSSLGLLSRFVGMLTDSRSFLSYARHEYFRRILCDVLGSDLASGRIPASEIETVHKMVQDISYNNAANYFKF